MASRSTNDRVEFRGLAVTIARDFRGRGVDTDDLIQEGMLEVLIAKRGWRAKRPDEPFPEKRAAHLIRNSLRRLTRPRKHKLTFDGDLDPWMERDVEPDTGAIAPLLALLSEREADVLTVRFGLDGNTERSHRETAEALGSRHSYIQKVEKQALAKLRTHLSRSSSI